MALTSDHNAGDERWQTSCVMLSIHTTWQTNNNSKWACILEGGVANRNAQSVSIVSCEWDRGVWTITMCYYDVFCCTSMDNSDEWQPNHFLFYFILCCYLSFGHHTWCLNYFKPHLKTMCTEEVDCRRLWKGLPIVVQSLWAPPAFPVSITYANRPLNESVLTKLLRRQLRVRAFAEVWQHLASVHFSVRPHWPRVRNRVSLLNTSAVETSSSHTINTRSNVRRNNYNHPAASPSREHVRLSLAHFQFCCGEGGQIPV